MTKIELYAKKLIRGKAGIFLYCMLALFLCGCVDQHPENVNGTEAEESINTEESAITEVSANTEVSQSSEVSAMLEITDETENAAVEAAKEKVKSLGREPKLIATSPATADICDKLNLDLVGVCTSAASAMPSRYNGVTEVGVAMSPDMEIISSLSPDWILSPASLQSDLQPKYESIAADWAFLNLKSVQGMYRSILELGIIFDRESEAGQLVSEFTEFYSQYKEKNEGRDHPKVLILMGLPGSYIIATPNSYVGNLVELAGGENVYSDTNEEFLTVNTEDMKTKEPDVILRAAHALPDQVAEMFAEEFAESDIWKHFTAVREGRVYDLSYDKFGMSAAFSYQEALDELQPMLYQEDSNMGEEEALDASDKAGD